MSEWALSIRDMRIDLPGPSGRLPVVRGVDLDLAPGKVTGLAGESGSGKSMTALALLNLLPAGAKRHAQQMRLGRDDILELTGKQQASIRGRRIAMIFQDPATAFDPVFRIGSQMASAIRRTRGDSAQGAARRVLDALDEAGFSDPKRIARSYPHQLSGGMRQLAMIAMAAAVRPEVLIADEPTTALDVTTQATVLKRLRSLAEDLGTAVLLISHDLAVLAQTTDHCLVMKDGLIVESARTRTLFASPQHTHTRELIAAVPRLDEELPDRQSPSPPTRDNALFSARDIVVRYPSRRDAPAAVNEVSLEIAPGEIFGLAGESGSGKSSLARVAARLLAPSEGELALEGRSLLTLKGSPDRKARQRIQIVFQDPASALSPRRTIGQTLAEPLRHFGLCTRDNEGKVIARALQDVGMDPEVTHRFPHQFSSGQRQRIAIARALVCEPELLIADEPVSALDVSVQARVLDLFQTLREQRGLAILFISHDLAVIRQLADRVGVMQQGKMVETGPVRKVLESPSHPYTKRLLASVPHLDPESRNGQFLEPPGMP